MERYRSEISTALLAAEDAYQNTVKRLAGVKQHESLGLLRNAKVQSK